MPRWKRWLASGFIAMYLTALSWGIVAHTVGVALGSHPVMYFVVWDMFCGWSAYEQRLHIIGETASGKYYELAPGPWGEIQPFGDIGRRHYDTLGNHSPKFALNAIRHTEHEPITRVFVVEELWHKKYNLPDEVWNQRFEEPRARHRYYNLRHVFTPDGGLMHSFPNWLSLETSLALQNNPRLLKQAARSRPFFAQSLRNRRPVGIYAPGTHTAKPVGSRNGN